MDGERSDSDGEQWARRLDEWSDGEAEQVFAMVAFARARGIPLPEAASQLPAREAWAKGGLHVHFRVAAAHEALANALYPARPETVAYLERVSLDDKRRLLGPVPLVRNLALTVMVFLAILVSLLVAASVADGGGVAVGFNSGGGSSGGSGGGVSDGEFGGSFDEDAQRVVARVAVMTRVASSAALIPEAVLSAAESEADADGNGLASAARMLAMIVAAALGAAFEALHRAMGDVEAATFDPDATHAYYLRVVYGVAAGVILVLIAGDQALGGEELPLTTFGLALLGGFGAPAVYRILARLVRSLEDLVGPEPTDVAASATRQAQLSVEHEKSTLLPLVALALAATDDQRRRTILERLWQDLGGGALPQ
jgi:hypothetical protein